MRVAILSDIHGNLLALKSILADIKKQQVDRIICLGDVASLGPQPAQVLAILQELKCLCTMGNHDAALIHPEAAAHYQIAPPVMPSVNWCLGQLTPTDIEFINNFQPTLKLPLSPTKHLLCFHGSPHSNIDNLLPSLSPQKLAEFISGHQASILCGGHTHLQLMRRIGNSVLVNPGSVGMPFRDEPAPGGEPIVLPWAEYAIIGEESTTITIDLRRVTFNIKEYVKTLSESELPLKNWLIGQYQSMA